MNMLEPIMKKAEEIYLSQKAVENPQAFQVAYEYAIKKVYNVSQSKLSTEARLLSFLKANAGKTVTRDTIIQAVWGSKGLPSNTRTVDVHISKLRLSGYKITTVMGVGYKLDKEAA